MPVFEYRFHVQAPLEAVSDFHHDTSVLKRLMPPPVIVQLHQFEPLGEGSRADFTLWFGPLPIHWTAVHSDVSVNGFTDTQTRGPLRQWVHTHRFSAVDADLTEVHEHLAYEYGSGLWAIVTRLLFNKPALTLMFTYRKWITRRFAGREGKPAGSPS